MRFPQYSQAAQRRSWACSSATIVARRSSITTRALQVPSGAVSGSRRRASMMTVTGQPFASAVRTSVTGPSPPEGSG